MNKRVAGYVLSVPERVVRSFTALGAGLLREFGELVLPRGVRRTRLYRSLVDDTLRFLIESVGDVKDAYPPKGALADNFAMRRLAGNGIEAIGLLTFRASPVWVLGALADLSGAGRQLVHEIGASLQEQGLLERAPNYDTIDQILDGLERTAGQLAEGLNTPPLDIAGLRQEWTLLREQARTIPAPRMPSVDVLWRNWRDLKATAAAQNRSIFEVSSLVALAAAGKLPDQARWLSRCAQTAVRSTGGLFAGGLLDHYRDTLAEIRRTGYAAYWIREFRPYLRAAVRQFGAGQTTMTEALLAKKWRARPTSAGEWKKEQPPTPPAG